MEANNLALQQSGAMSANPANRRPPAVERERTQETPASPAGRAAEPNSPVNNAPGSSVDISSTGIDLAISPIAEHDRPVTFNEQDIPDSRIAEYVNMVNVALEPSFFRLDHSIHEATNMVMVQVIDTNSEEVVREIPSESRLDVMAKMLEFAGLLFDEAG
jgi:flagellar protein FlaG